MYLAFRESECFYWFIKGLDRNQIAEKLSIALSSVETNFSTVRSRFKVETREKVIAILMENDFLERFEELKASLDNLED